jgi:peptidoglycan/LPS O-acetylase OafA/YrhL
MTRQGITYQPALDGVRAVSVLAVLLFHGGIPGFSGGYLGVSVFFTLSGFLITSLMLAEHESQGRVAVGAFYVRRAKRLLPASLLCVATITVLATTTRIFSGAEALRRDLVGALLQVANWVSLAGNGSYQHLLTRSAGLASPVEHYWSLAIEEQFYWLWPLAFIGLHRLVRSRNGATVAVAVATGLFGVAAPVIATVWGPDAAYWASPARAAEILAGVLAAFVVHGRQVPQRASLAAPVSLAVLCIAIVTFPAGSGPAYHGALPLVGLASALLIVGLQVPGPTRALLSIAPLVWLGRISYGVYLFHWPVYVVLDAQRTGLGDLALFALRIAVTFAIAVASFYFVERPIRTGLSWRPSRVGALALVSSAAVLVTAVVTVGPGRGSYWRTTAVADAASIETVTAGTLPPLVASSSAIDTAPGSTSDPAGAAAGAGVAPVDPPSAVTSAASTTSTETPLPPLSRPMRVVVAGDSTAEATGMGLAQWAVEQPGIAQVTILAAEGCGFLRGGTFDAGGWTKYQPRCATWLDDELPRRTAELQPDVVMMMTSSWDVLDRRWPGGGTLTPFDDAYALRLLADFSDITDRLLAAGTAHVVWIREPEPVPLWGYGGLQAQSDPARHRVIADIMDAIAAAHPGLVSVVDLRTWLAASTLLDDHNARPDGVHWTPEAAARIARGFLGERLLRAALGI